MVAIPAHRHWAIWLGSGRLAIAAAGGVDLAAAGAAGVPFNSTLGEQEALPIAPGSRPGNDGNSTLLALNATDSSADEGTELLYSNTDAGELAAAGAASTHLNSTLGEQEAPPRAPGRPGNGRNSTLPALNATGSGVDEGKVLLNSNTTTDAELNEGNAGIGLTRANASISVADAGSFDYHKPAFPLDWHHDGLTILFSSIGLIIAASGGIGGGGILVPLFMLLLKFRPKHAIALSNFTILGGAIANTWLNCRKRHPHHDRSLIDWDLILIMEPLTIAGAVLGSLLSKVLPNVMLTTALVVILSFMGHRTFKKGLMMWYEEAGCAARDVASGIEMHTPERGPKPSNGHALPNLSDDEEEDLGGEQPYLELLSDSEGPRPKPSFAPWGSHSVNCKIGALTCCFVGTCALTVLKGSGHFESPLGFSCGSPGFWALYFSSLPWVLGFAVSFRRMLIGEFEQKVSRGHVFAPGEVQWNPTNTLKYPAICAISGLLAGLFGVGGGIVKGPLMLEMGIMPAVASASAAAMILFTSAAASVSFIAFGLLHPIYGMMFFLLGLGCTALGQYSVGQWVKRHDRQSPIVLSIGLVILLSSLLVAVDTLAESSGKTAGELMRPHGVCATEA